MNVRIETKPSFQVAGLALKNAQAHDLPGLWDLTDHELAAKLGMEILDVPEAEYAIFKLQGPVPARFHQGWEYAMGTWLSENGYRHAGTPDFENYFEGDLNSLDYKMELWVPIVKI